jgi:hypothetical protein
MKYNDIQSNAIQLSSVQFCSVQFSSIPFSLVSFRFVSCRSVAFSSVQFGSVQFSLVPFSWMQFSSIQLSLQICGSQNNPTFVGSSPLRCRICSVHVIWKRTTRGSFLNLEQSIRASPDHVGDFQAGTSSPGCIASSSDDEKPSAPFSTRSTIHASITSETEVSRR